MTTMITTVVWYDETQWNKLWKCSEDGNRMDTEYAKWLASAENQVKTLTQRGWTVHKLNINVDQLLAWAEEKNLPINERTRLEFTKYLMAAQAGFTETSMAHFQNDPDESTMAATAIK